MDPKELKSGTQLFVLSMLIIALFTVANGWKQPKCPSKAEWTSKTVYTYNGIVSLILSQEVKELTFLKALLGTLIVFVSFITLLKICNLHL